MYVHVGCMPMQPKFYFCSSFCCCCASLPAPLQRVPWCYSKIFWYWVLALGKQMWEVLTTPLLLVFSWAVYCICPHLDIDMTCALMANQMGFFVFNSEMQPDCGCLSVRQDVCDDVPTASMDGWIWMFLYWPSSSHLSPMQRLKTSIWKVILLWQPHDSPFHFPKSLLLHYKEDTCLVRSKGQKCDWENMVSKTVQRKTSWRSQCDSQCAWKWIQTGHRR